MRAVPESMTLGWNAPDKTGLRRPVVRATIQNLTGQEYPYDTGDTGGADLVADTFGLNASTDVNHRPGNYFSVIFGQDAPVREVPNILAFTWSRSVDQEVATAKLTLLNSEPVPVGTAPVTKEFDQPGALTYSYGLEDSQSKWGYAENGWQNVFVPDRVVRTYEGYGQNSDVWPADDPHLMSTGVWIIDDVNYNGNTIELVMRDLGRMLLDQIVFPPVIPATQYPLTFSTLKDFEVTAYNNQGGIQFHPSGTVHTSNEFYVGRGIPTSDGSAYVDDNGAWEGHLASYPLIADDTLQWLSTGEDWPDGNIRAWWEIDFDQPQDILWISLRSLGGQACWVSIADSNGNWIGNNTIPYDVSSLGVDIGAGIPFVQQNPLFANNQPDNYLQGALDQYGAIRPRFRGVTKVRLTFGMLNDFGGDRNHPWRASLTNFELYAGVNSYTTQSGITERVGNINDWTDVVRQALAWGGWYWPAPSTGRDFIMTAPGEKTFVHQGSPDPSLWGFRTAGTNGLPEGGSVWGDLMPAGTAPVADLTPDLFDKQPLRSLISQAQDVLGFVSFVDEDGVFVWRMPNRFKPGNWLVKDGVGKTHVETAVTIADDGTMLDYQPTLSSQNLRDRLFVANTAGTPAVIRDSFVPFPSNLRRTAGWSDQHFETAEECQTMADFIATAQKFGFKVGKVTIPGYPAIQLDDQIQLFERTTNETYLHYVRGITMNYDAKSGDWTYTLDTHWLGDQYGNWVVNTTTELNPGAENRLIQAGLL